MKIIGGLSDEGTIIFFVFLSVCFVSLLEVAPFVRTGRSDRPVRKRVSSGN